MEERKRITAKQILYILYAVISLILGIVCLWGCCINWSLFQTDGTMGQQFFWLTVAAVFFWNCYNGYDQSKKLREEKRRSKEHEGNDEATRNGQDKQNIWKVLWIIVSLLGICGCLMGFYLLFVKSTIASERIYNVAEILFFAWLAYYGRGQLK